MQYGDFIERVQKRAGISHWQEAQVAIEATLKTLGERLTDKEATDLAAQLPPAIGRFLTVVDTDKDFNLEEFYKNVSLRESLDPSSSREHVRAVMSVLVEAVSPGELQDVLNQLPEEYTHLFTFGGDSRKIEGR